MAADRLLDMLECARRLADLTGCRGWRSGSVASFLDRVRQEPDLATWVGELYLETHRGTLTTHADVKLANRRAEEALRAAEMWSVAAGINRQADLERAWKRLLVQQFHDILPGSSIRWVYEDAPESRRRCCGRAEEVSCESQAAVLAGAGEAWWPSTPRRGIATRWPSCLTGGWKWSGRRRAGGRL